MSLGMRSILVKKRVLLAIAWFLGAVPMMTNAALNSAVTATRCVETNATMNGSQLLRHMYHYWDSVGAIKTPDLDAGFKLSEFAQGFPFTQLIDPGKQANFGRTQGNHWLRFCLRNIGTQPQNLVLAFEPPTLTEIDFYPQTPGLTSFKTGSSKTMSTRDIPNSQFDFNARLLPGEQQTFYVRVYAATTPFLVAKLWDRSSYDVDNNLKESWFGIFVGVLMGLVIYNLLLFASARQLTSLFYIAWSLSVFIMILSIDGRLVQYLVPDHPQLSRTVTVIFFPLSVYLTAFLCREFIKLKNYPKVYKIGNVLMAFSLIALLLAYFYDSAIYSRVCSIFAIIAGAYFCLFAPIYALIKDRLAAAKYVLITQAPIILCIVDRTLFALEVTSEYYVPYTTMTALIAAIILFSYYIGLMAHREKEAAQREKGAAQRSALEQLNISNTLKSNYNAQLEKELEQKTADIRSMNSDLERQAKKLLQLNESKSKFFANISHEFRTPLTLIEGPLTMLLERDGFPEKSTLEGVVRNSNSLKHLIDQILLLSELDEQSLSLKTSQTNIVQTVNEFSAQFASVIEQKGLRLSCTAQQPEIYAYVDDEKLQIIINNLLSNAIKFSQSPGHIHIDISASVAYAKHKDEYSRDEYVQIKVSDTGQGIPSSELAYVFDRYFQSDSSELSKSGLGTGIGLALVKELVNLHAGEVTVQSTYQHEITPQEHSQPENNHDIGLHPSSGTTFCVTLPLGRAHLSDSEIVQSDGLEGERTQALLSTEPQRDETEPRRDEKKPQHIDALESSNESQGKRATILVVDDNQDMRRHISRLLEGDYNIMTAQDGLLAEKALTEHLPDLIVTDLMMPNRNGLEFVESIKKNDEFVNIPIIMLTARAGLDDRIKGLVAAVDDYLVKPFNGRELKARITNLLIKQAQFTAFYKNQSFQEKASEAGRDLKSEITSNTDTYLDKVKAIVNQRLEDPSFGVAELANALHVSEATLRRRLSERAKFTPAAFIRHCRLERARELSQQGHMRSISELAHAVGFSKSSYFSRLYQKTFNSEVGEHSEK